MTRSSVFQRARQAKHNDKNQEQNEPECKGDNSEASTRDTRSCKTRLPSSYTVRHWPLVRRTRTHRYCSGSGLRSLHKRNRLLWRASNLGPVSDLEVVQSHRLVDIGVLLNPQLPDATAKLGFCSCNDPSCQPSNLQTQCDASARLRHKIQQGPVDISNPGRELN